MDILLILLQQHKINDEHKCATRVNLSLDLNLVNLI